MSRGIGLRIAQGFVVHAIDLHFPTPQIHVGSQESYQRGFAFFASQLVGEESHVQNSASHGLVEVDLAGGPDDGRGAEFVLPEGGAQGVAQGLSGQTAVRGGGCGVSVPDVDEIGR